MQTLLYLGVHHGRLQARVVAKGLQAAPTWSAESVALAHPRTLIGDYAAVQQLLRQAFMALLPRHWLAIAPMAIVHLLRAMQGGYTQVKACAFLEAARQAGARKV